MNNKKIINEINNEIKNLEDKMKPQDKQLNYDLTDETTSKVEYIDGLFNVIQSYVEKIG